jgi:DNA-binding HxlR family transcriptional regulator
MLNDDDLRGIGQARWTAPLLAALLERDGARFTELLIALDCARDTLTSTLAHAIETGWVMRNPGYGHPLRPDYILSPRGKVVAAACSRLMAIRARLGLASSDLPRWSLPILGRLRKDWSRFSDLQASLTPITSRALSLTLKQMIDIAVVDRRLEDSFPPTAFYGLTLSGRELASGLQPD